MNLLTKAGPWVVASLLATASAFGQDRPGCPPKKCEEMKQIQLAAGYNAPSRVDVRGCWDIYASAGFTYWQPIQENMELGVLLDQSVEKSAQTQTVLKQEFGYKPGFKVALGMNFDYDNWDSMVQYAWFRGSETTKASVDLSKNSLSSSKYLAPIGEDDALMFDIIQLTNMSQNAQLHMDLLDWDLGRNHYVGTKLTVRPSFGARAAWIRQNVQANVDGLNQEPTTPTAVNVSTQKTSHSWGVGPRAGVATNWNLGDGFRIFGNGSGDILFTRYTRANQKVDVNAVTPLQFKPFKSNQFTQTDINSLRTHLELEIGFGWGSYFDCYNWHVDLSAGYGFQVFFDQNMFRPLANLEVGTPLPNGNLYVHGLTASARLDF